MMLAPRHTSPPPARDPLLVAFIEAMGELIARRVLADYQNNLKRGAPHIAARPKGGQ